MHAPSETPLDRTQALLDVSVTERATFRSCRRRWHLTTIENLQPKQADQFALNFGTGIHEALETFYAGRGARATRIKNAYKVFDAWGKVEREAAIDNDAFQIVREHEALGAGMLEQYFTYDEVASVQLGTPVAVEGKFKTTAYKPKRPAGYPKSAEVILDNGRLLCPIVHPDTKEPLVGPDGRTPYLTARIDLLTERKTPKSGLWVADHKTATSAPADKGIDYDDQITGYCYVVWRWLDKIPRGVVYNVLIKNVPKEPRLVQPQKKEFKQWANADGLVLSTAKDQLTTPNMYRAALKEQGLMRGNRVMSDAHAECLGALIARGWDPFFRRYEVMRNAHELNSFEGHLVQEYDDMFEAYELPEKRYPNRSTWHCPGCPVNKICLAQEDGSDVECIIDNQYVPGPDRKAAR